MKIAIDGPAGAGKSTVAKQVAAKLRFVYIDTGAMYRALAWASQQEGLAAIDEHAVSTLLEKNRIKLQRDDQGDAQRVWWNEEDITAEIRTPQMSQLASIVAGHPRVRALMLDLQRALAEEGNVIMDGRDIGTHVLPDADVKIFLTASIEERATRRLAELQQKGVETSLEALMEEIAERDKRDSEREVAPLKQAEDAILVDTTGRSIEQIVDQILHICQKTGESAK
ncbi:(d)CMP kinase [Brevibacillus fluminis]|uniref:Cytidylate kinase n=1 Tax=Brevibacillus fluminis TaxID=511487 RepID=A0A3M8D152_9BACL|nr:(d)CMP kinase [Brevibacillus fluminis]RNB81608.1 (d)CMP kinase [Brevibacillus fluminis]